MYHRAKVDNKDQHCRIIVYEARLAEVLPGLQPKQNLSCEQSSR
jgi:hypothetical protein